MICTLAGLFERASIHSLREGEQFTDGFNIFIGAKAAMKEVEAQEQHADELRRHAQASESQPLPPAIKGVMEAIEGFKDLIDRGERDPNALKIAHEDSTEFEQSQPELDYVIRTVIVCIENIDTTHSISNCRVHLEMNGADYLLVDSFTLGPTEKRVVQIATHRRFPGDNRIHLHIPVQYGEYMSSRPRLRVPLSGALLTIKAMSAETRSVQLTCRVFVDESGNLKMENARRRI
jgi:hypothetical protein